MLEFLNKKRILFFGLGFYGYEDAIKQNLEQNGAIVDYINTLKLSKPQIFFYKLCRKESVADNFRKKNIWNAIKPFDGNLYDYIFVIRGDTFTKGFIDYLRNCFPAAYFILYMWDTLIRYPEIIPLIKFFDKVMSFDYADCEKYKIPYRPLFCRNFSERKDKDIDLLFVGTSHTDRLKIIQNLYFNISQKNKCLFKIYMPKTTFIKIALLKKVKPEFIKNCIITKPIPQEEYFALLERTKAIIDIHHPNQTGLTIRTIEAIGNTCFIFTTNENIKKEHIPESFYKIIGRDMTEVDLPQNLPSNTFDAKKYTITTFINDLFARNKKMSLPQKIRAVHLRRP